MLTVRTTVATVAAIVTATSLSAASYTFDLHKVDSYHVNDGDDGTISGQTLTVVQSSDGVDLTGTFTGKYIENAGSAGGLLTGTTIENADSILRHNNGLGVCNVGACFHSEGDQFHTVDGATDGGLRTDFVEMAFFAEGSAVDVTLTSLTFGWIGSVYNDYQNTTGAFDILISDVSETMISLGDILTYSGVATINIAGIGGRGLFDLSGIASLTDNLFGIKAGAGGSWKLMAATVDYTVPDVPEIPLPAAGWLLIGGVGALVALRRRKPA